MKRSWRTGLRSRSMEDGKYHVDHVDAGREEKLPASTGADVIAAYHYGRVYQQRRILPEKRLMRAVLNDAIAEFHRHAPACDHKAKKSFREVEAWILDKNFDWVFSFENICAVLGFDPDYLRRGLRRSGQVKLVNVLTRSAA